MHTYGNYVASELKPGEMWIANTHAIRPEFKHLKTLRLGEQALDVYGKKLPLPWRPLFIHKSEYAEYNRIWNKIITGWE